MDVVHLKSPMPFSRSSFLAAVLYAAGLLLMPAASLAGDNRLETLIVTASPIARPLAELDQSVTLLTRDDILAAPVADLASLLQLAGGVDVRQRGGPGVQADVGVRGTAFEQTRILLDGVPMGDPQTGHHDLNLPLPLEHLERIEIVKGPGSAAFGPGVTGGTINFVTRRPEAFEAGAFLRGGQHDYLGLGAHLGWSGEHSGHLVSASRRRSDGHISNEPTDFDLVSAYYSGHFDLGEHSVRIGAGIDDRDFGAFKFYVDRFPDQREETRTLSAQASADVHAGAWLLTPALSWRQHEDWFRTHIPALSADFINEHETRVLRARLGARRETALGTLALGAGLAEERIDSTALGDHDRRENSVWGEQQFNLGDRWRLALSAAWVDYSDYGDSFLPGASLGLQLRDDTAVFASLARSVRIPSYIEQFLRGGAGNEGNPNLVPERSWQGELGLRWQQRAQSLSIALFERRTQNLIDWGRSSPDVDFLAGNFGGHRTRGGEIEYRFEATAFAGWRLAYTHLHTRLDTRGLEMAYALDHPRHELVTALDLRWLPNLHQALQLRWVDRRGGESVTLLASRLSWQWRQLTLSLEGSNLLDRDYVEAGFAPQPGRWVVAGIAWRL